MTLSFPDIIFRASSCIVFGGDAIMASAALDRLLHRCTVVNIRGESFRLKEKRQAARSTMAQLANTDPQGGQF